MDEQPACTSLLLVDIVARDKGHAIDDDFFLSECLPPLAGRFAVRSSPTSVANISERLPVNAEAVPGPRWQVGPRAYIAKLLSILRLRTLGYEDVVFQGFDELSTLLFMFLHPNTRVHLVVCNNLSPDRMVRHPIAVSFLLTRIFRRAASIFVHCQFEVDMIRTRFKDVAPAKIFVKPFHQMSVRRRIRSYEERSQLVVFFGPALPRKPLGPMAELIREDEEQRYRYVLCAMEDIDTETQDFLDRQPNVDVRLGHLTDEEWHGLFSQATLVLMPHNSLYEGRLSGVFSDAIASGTPVIAQDMAPHSEFFERFGQMGYLVDYDEPEWWSSLLAADVKSQYDGFQRNMAACRESCSMQAIRRVFRSALERV